MVECENCLHSEVCDQSSRQMWSVMAGATRCSDFKDRTKWVEQKHGRCAWCDGDYHTTILATAIRHHSNGNMEGYELRVNYCPNCGADMREGSVGE